MKEKEQQFINTWQVYRERGKAIYMAGYALIYALITIAVSLLFRIDDAPIKDLILSEEFLTKLILFTLIGLILSHFKWKSRNNKYDEIMHLSNQKR